MDRDDYEAAGSCWRLLNRLKVIQNDEVEKMVSEQVLSKIQYYVQGCVSAFKSCTAQYQFDEAAQQLSLLHMLTDHFPGADLKINLEEEELESFLTQFREKKVEEQRNRDKTLEAAKRKAVQEKEKEMNEKIQQLA